MQDPLSETHDSEKSVKLTQFPLSRIKYLMKLDADVHLANQESVILIAKSTELFLEKLAKEACSFTVQAKRKTLQKKDIDMAIDKIDNLVFLEGTLEETSNFKKSQQADKLLN